MLKKEQYIKIKNARENNLKGVSLDIPRNKLIVITGLSGSGKSSLAFDTLYAEGQRRYVESLSAYARQFMGRMHKPACDYIKGLPPAIAIEQKVSTRNPRSTVGTSTEIYDYLRMLFARVGHTFSPVSGAEVRHNSVDDVINCAHTYSEGTRFSILAPLRVRSGRSIKEQLSVNLQQGFSRIEKDGEVVRIEDVLNEPLENKKLYLLIDRLVVSREKELIFRMTDSVETALFEGDGECALRFYPACILHEFSTHFERDGITFREPDEAMFSFNSPAGACPECEGFGKIIGIDPHLVIPNTALSVYDGAVACWRGQKMQLWKEEFIRRVADINFPIFKPYYELTEQEKDILWHGDEREKALPEEQQVTIDAFFRMLERGQYKIQNRVMLAHYRGKTECPLCHGSRLKKEAEYVKVGGKNITELVKMPISELQKFFAALILPPHDELVAKRLLTEIRSRLEFLVEVGLSYLTLDRLSNSLSGGESQRINLATSLGSSLVGSLYILDEPSIGLHPRDTEQLICVLKKLRDLGNTVIVVEHDEEIMRAADYLVDMGPYAGRLGGEVVYKGNLNFANPPVLPKNKNGMYTSHTLNYLFHLESIEKPFSRRVWNKSISVIGARENNLKGINVKFPLNVLTVVTGVSGSGKSTLVKNILYRALQRNKDIAGEKPGEYIRLEGSIEDIANIEFVDQNPIGKSTRSNPVTYIKAYDEIRKMMAQQPLAKQMGFTAADFSFNSGNGRCEQCNGEGVVKVEMQFMADLELECDACHGKRFKKEILEVKFADKSVYDILELTVDEAILFFSENQKFRIAKLLQPLQDVGLGYVKLGQASSTLSGGENQRVKLAYYIGMEANLPTLFIFDEPTTGLHFNDINRLLAAFNALIVRGHTLVVIEHNLDVIKCADYVIDLGPEGGRAGGEVVAEGTPEQIVKAGRGYTAKYLAHYLSKS